jgi:hypothetical protein
MTNEHSFSDTPSPELIQLQAKQMALDSGLLGKVFGGSKTAPTNIAGLCLVLFVVPGIVLLFYDGAKLSAKEYWASLTPIVTLILGYLFGKNG